MSVNPLIEVERWIEEFVIGLGLCPFAAQPFRRGLVRYVCCADPLEAAILNLVSREARTLVDTPPQKIATTIVIVTHGYRSFDGYLAGLERVERLLFEMGLEGILQVASFHPDYRFQDAPAKDPANHTNRSPYPLFHLIREDDVEKAREDYPDVEGISERNVTLLRRLASEGKLKSARRGKW